MLQMVVDRSSPLDGDPAVGRDHNSDAANEQLPLSPPVYHVLLALGNEAMHGYAIMQSFADLTRGGEELLPGTLYATLARMVETGLLEETPSPESGGDARRRYYRCTGFGRAVAAAEADRMRRLLQVAAARGMAPGEVG